MTAFFLVTIFIAASMSLVSYIYCWEDIKSGQPHIISLRQITCVMNRDRLNSLFGPPKPGYYYELSQEQVSAIVRSRQVFVYKELLADILCLFGAWFYMMGMGHPAMLRWFIVAGGAYQAINMAHSAWLLHKWQHQIREEIESSED